MTHELTELTMTSRGLRQWGQRKEGMANCKLDLNGYRYIFFNKRYLEAKSTFLSIAEVHSVLSSHGLGCQKQPNVKLIQGERQFWISYMT